MWISLDKRLCKLRFINTCHSFSRADCFTLKFRLVKYLLFLLKGLKLGLISPVLGTFKGPNRLSARHKGRLLVDPAVVITTCNLFARRQSSYRPQIRDCFTGAWNLSVLPSRFSIAPM